MSGIGLMLLGAKGATLNVTASPPALNSGASVNSFTTAATVATAADGSGTYTYAWTLIVTPGGITINTPAAPGTTFTLTVAVGAVIDATARCTATDSVTLATATVDVAIQHVDAR